MKLRLLAGIMTLVCSFSVAMCGHVLQMRTLEDLRSLAQAAAEAPEDRLGEKTAALLARWEENGSLLIWMWRDEYAALNGSFLALALAKEGRDIPALRAAATETYLALLGAEEKERPILKNIL